MKTQFAKTYITYDTLSEELSPLNLPDSIQKTRQALDMAYAGFDDALEVDLIDSYIYEIISLQKKYKYLINLAAEKNYAPAEPVKRTSPIRTFVNHVFS